MTLIHWASCKQKMWISRKGTTREKREETGVFSGSEDGGLRRSQFPTSSHRRTELCIKFHRLDFTCCILLVVSCCCLVSKSCLTWQPHGLQHARLLCLPLPPAVCSNSCELSCVPPAYFLARAREDSCDRDGGMNWLHGGGRRDGLQVPASTLCW